MNTNLFKAGLFQLITIVLLTGCSAKQDAQTLTNDLVESNEAFQPYFAQVHKTYLNEINTFNTVINNHEQYVIKSTEIITKQTKSLNKAELELSKMMVEVDYFKTINIVDIQLASFQLNLELKVLAKMQSLTNEVKKFEQKAITAKQTAKDNENDSVLQGEYSKAVAQYLSRLTTLNTLKNNIINQIKVDITDTKRAYEKRAVDTKKNQLNHLESIFVNHNKPSIALKRPTKPENYNGLTKQFDNIATYQKLNSDAARSLKNYFYVTGFGAESLMADAIKSFGKASVSQLFNPVNVKSDFDSLTTDKQVLFNSASADIKEQFNQAKSLANNAFKEIEIDFKSTAIKKLDELIISYVRKAL